MLTFDKNLTKEDIEKLVLLGIVGIILGIAAVVFVISPGLKSGKKTKLKLNEARQKVEAAEKLIRSVPAMKEKVEELKKENLRYRETLPKKTGYSWFLEYLNQLRNKLNIKFESIVPKESEKSEEIKIAGYTYKKILILINLRGDYHKVGKLINELENYSDFIGVQYVNIRLDKEDIVRQKVTLRVSLLIME